MKKLQIISKLGLGALTLIAATAVARADSISPTSFEATGPTGFTSSVTKTVTVTSEVAGVKADIFFLSDTTGSMGGTIAAVQGAASSILAGTAALGDVQWGVGEYRDFGDAFVYQTNTDITATQANVTAGINSWDASGGGDIPEANLFALTQVANTASWRDGSQRIVVWFGDAPGHDPSGAATLASTILALQAEGVITIAFNVGSAQLDSTGQATAITNATGGSLHGDLTDPVNDVIDAITATFATYSSVCLDASEAPSAVSVGVSGTGVIGGCITGSFDRETDQIFTFGR